MKLVTSCCVTVVASCFALAAGACENPTMVAVPDGATSTEPQLIEAQGKVKTYIAAMEEYLACLNEEIEAAGEEAPEEFKTLMITRHNTAVTEMESVAAAFNEQVKAFRAANPRPASN